MARRPRQGIESDDPLFDHEGQARQLVKIRQTLLKAELKTGLRDGTAPRKARARKQVIAPTGDETSYAPFEAVDQVHAQRGALRTREEADDDAQAAEVVRGKGRLKAAFYQVTGPPPECGPGDVGSARRYHTRLLRALEESAWTHSERAALLSLERRWRARANGSDARFMRAGNKAGRLNRDVEREIGLARKNGRREDV